MKRGTQRFETEREFEQRGGRKVIIPPLVPIIPSPPSDFNPKERFEDKEDRVEHKRREKEERLQALRENRKLREQHQLEKKIERETLRSQIREQKRTEKIMAGRTASELTQAKKDSKAARAILKQMVDSYMAQPAEYKAEAIKDALADVETAENVLREKNREKEGDLFAKYKNAAPVAEEESNEEEEEDEEEETPAPVKTEIPRPMTAKNQATRKK